MDPAFYKQLLAWADQIERMAYRPEVRVYGSAQADVRDVRVPEPVLVMDAPEDLTLTEDDLGIIHVFNATAAIDVTLPGSFDGGWVELLNYGANAITVKNASAATIGTLNQYQRARIQSWPDSDGIFGWPTKLIVEGADGTLFMENNIFFRVGYPIVPDDTDNHFYALTTSSGAITETDEGTSESTVTEPGI